MTKFTKPSLNLEEKIELLKERGLIIDNEESAKNYLQHIGYFKLTGYFKFFQDKETNKFFDGIEFQKIIDLYVFDRKLRLLTLDAIEKIEISLKANINDYITKEFGCFWYKNEELFNLNYKDNLKIYNEILGKTIPEINQRKTIFIKHYFEKYEEECLPSWMLFEELTFGEAVKMYKILKKDYKIEISKNYKVDYKDFSNWITLVKKIRNIVAHHERLWNNEYNMWLSSNDKIFGNIFQKRVIDNGGNEVIANYYNSALIMNYLLKQININLGWLDDLEILFNEYIEIPKKKMGFIENWKENFI